MAQAYSTSVQYSIYAFWPLQLSMTASTVTKLLQTAVKYLRNDVGSCVKFDLASKTFC